MDSGIKKNHKPIVWTRLCWNRDKILIMRTPTVEATVVAEIAEAATPLADKALPALNPYQPIHNNAVPIAAKGLF